MPRRRSLFGPAVPSAGTSLVPPPAVADADLHPGALQLMALALPRCARARERARERRAGVVTLDHFEYYLRASPRAGGGSIVLQYVSLAPRGWLSTSRRLSHELALSVLMGLVGRARLRPPLGSYRASQQDSPPRHARSATWAAPPRAFVPPRGPRGWGGTGAGGVNQLLPPNPLASSSFLSHASYPPSAVPSAVPNRSEFTHPRAHTPPPTPPRFMHPHHSHHASHHASPAREPPQRRVHHRSYSSPSAASTAATSSAPKAPPSE